MTLLLQILLEYVDRFSGFSHLFGEYQVRKLANKLLVLKEKKEKKKMRLQKLGEVYDTNEDVKERSPFWRKIESFVAKLFRRDRKATTVEGLSPSLPGP